MKRKHRALATVKKEKKKKRERENARLINEIHLEGTRRPREERATRENYAGKQSPGKRVVLFTEYVTRKTYRNTMSKKKYLCLIRVKRRRAHGVYAHARRACVEPGAYSRCYRAGEHATRRRSAYNQRSYKLRAACILARRSSTPGNQGAGERKKKEGETREEARETRQRR